MELDDCCLLYYHCNRLHLVVLMQTDEEPEKVVVGDDYISAIATSCLWFVVPSSELTEQSQNWMIVITLVLSYLAIITNDGVYTFYNALLPSVAEKKWMGRVSGWAFGVGYISGLVALFCALPIVAPSMFGLSEPLFGISTENATNIRITMPFVSIWLLIFSIPLFLYVAEPEKANEPSFRETFKSGLQAVIQIPGLLRFLIARCFMRCTSCCFCNGWNIWGTVFGFSIVGL